MFLPVCIGPDCSRDTLARSDASTGVPEHAICARWGGECAPLLRRKACFLRRLRRKISPARWAAVARLLRGRFCLETQTRRAAQPKQNGEAAGRGIRTEASDRGKDRENAGGMSFYGNTCPKDSTAFRTPAQPDGSEAIASRLPLIRLQNRKRMNHTVLHRQLPNAWSSCT